MTKINRRKLLKAFGLFGVTTASIPFLGMLKKPAFGASRETVVIWMTKIVGGDGHFGIDLTLDDGKNPCGSDQWQSLCCGTSYYRCPSFGPNAPSRDELTHGYWITNFHPDGTRTDFARRLRRVDIEIYPKDKIERVNKEGRREELPKYMMLRTDTSSFEWYRHGRHYSDHIGEVVLPQVNYDTPNYGSLHGYILKNDKRVEGYSFRIACFGEGTGGHVQTDTGHPMWGMVERGNHEKGSYYHTGPVVRGRYKVNYTLIAPNGSEAHGQDSIMIDRPHIPNPIRVENFFT